MTSEMLGESSPSFDLFISHVWEDRDAVASPLAKALSERGLSIYGDEESVRVGYSIPGEINRRIRCSRSAVTVLSKAYIANRWACHELDQLVYLAMSTGRKIYPVCQKIAADELGGYELFFTTINCLDADEQSIETIADEICRAVSQESK